MFTVADIVAKGNAFKWFKRSTKYFQFSFQLLECPFCKLILHYKNGKNS